LVGTRGMIGEAGAWNCLSWNLYARNYLRLVLPQSIYNASIYLRPSLSQAFWKKRTNCGVIETKKSDCDDHAALPRSLFCGSTGRYRANVPMNVQSCSPPQRVAGMYSMCVRTCSILPHAGRTPDAGELVVFDKGTMEGAGACLLTMFGLCMSIHADAAPEHSGQLDSGCPFRGRDPTVGAFYLAGRTPGERQQCSGAGESATYIAS